MADTQPKDFERPWLAESKKSAYYKRRYPKTAEALGTDIEWVPGGLPEEGPPFDTTLGPAFRHKLAEGVDEPPQKRDLDEATWYMPYEIEGFDAKKRYNELSGLGAMAGGLAQVGTVHGETPSAAPLEEAIDDQQKKHASQMSPVRQSGLRDQIALRRLELDYQRAQDQARLGSQKAAAEAEKLQAQIWETQQKMALERDRLQKGKPTLIRGRGQDGEPGYFAVDPENPGEPRAVPGVSPMEQGGRPQGTAVVDGKTREDHYQENLKVQGLSLLPGYRPSSGEASTIKKAKGRYDAVKDRMRALEEEFKRSGAQLTGPAATKMRNYARDVMLELKELVNLGVLNGPDLRILNDLVPSPATLDEVALSKMGIVDIQAKFEAFNESLDAKFKAGIGPYGYQMAPGETGAVPDAQVDPEGAGGRALPPLPTPEEAAKMSVEELRKIIDARKAARGAK